MSGCLECKDPIPACPSGCPANACAVRQRSCTVCATTICQTSDASSGGGGGGGSSIGGTVGGALGGVLGVAAALGLIYWFWWKPRGLAASRKRYSRHLSHRQSKPPGDRKPSSPDANVTKRTSVHLRMDGGVAGAEGLARRTSPGPGGRNDAGTPISVGATGGHSTRTSLESDNPFGDHARSSIGTFADYPDDASTRTSEFSFRSSHSTNIIPIAYIPPHSSSMAVEDNNRGAYGEILIDPPSRGSLGVSSSARASIPSSMASRDSLALAGAEIIDLHPLPPALSPDTPAVPFGTSSNGAPIRPPRSPGLDLQLPPGTPTTPLASPRDSRLGLRPSSGFPFGAPASSGSSQLSPGGSTQRGMSVLLDPKAQAHLSTISSMSGSTTRSGNSTMSYILDPPQIITPVNAQGVRRVEVMGRGQAGLIRIGGSGAGSPPSTPALDGISSTLSSPTTPKAFDSLQGSAAVNPFSDAASVTPILPRFSVGGVTSSPLATAIPLGPAPGHRREESEDTITDASEGHTDGSSRWTASSFADSDVSRSINAQSIAFDAAPPSSPGRLTQTSSTFFDMPHSARSSEAYGLGDDRGMRSRSLTGVSDSGWTINTTAATSGGSSPSIDSRRPSSAASFVSSRSGQTDSMLMLDGIPFMGPATAEQRLLVTTTPGGSAGPAAPSSPLFPMPPPRSPSIFGPPSPTDSNLTSTTPSPPSEPAVQPPTPTAPATGLGVLAAASAANNDAEDDTLPAPFLPFAGQRPTSLATSDAGINSRESQAISVRSGFGSGLSQIPFQLDGGLRDSMMESERGSMISLGPRDSRTTIGTRDSRMGRAEGDGDEDEEEGMLSGVDEQTEPDSRRTSYNSVMSSQDGEDEEEEEEAVIVTQATREPLQRSTSVKKAVPRSPQVPSTTETKEEENPFGEHAEVQPTGGADPRASMDSMELSLSLSRSLDGLDS